MNKCHKCGGSNLRETSIFCPDCGTQLKELPPDIAALVAGRTEEERMTPKEVEVCYSIPIDEKTRRIIKQ